MASGYIDLFTTRRNYYAKCYWWKRDDSNFSKDLAELVIENKPKGYFYAKEETASTNQKQVVGGLFQFDQNSITLKTQDAIGDEIKSNDVVLYDGKHYMVTNVQTQKLKKQGEFSKKTSYITYLSLKG